MKITEYPAAEGLVNNDLLLLDGPQGTRNITAGIIAGALLSLLSSKDIVSNIDLSQLDQAKLSDITDVDKLLLGTSDGNKGVNITDAFYGVIDLLGSAFTNVNELSLRRSIWRGKNLGSYVTDEQYAAIADGSFKGLFLGDYWQDSTNFWRIVDFDYWIHSGDTPCETHHLVIMPDQQVTTSKMNETNITTGGYLGVTTMGSTLGNVCLPIVNAIFAPSHILNHREYFTNAVTNGYPSAGIWYDSVLDLPNEIMIYGCQVFTPKGDGSFVPNLYTIDKTQLAAMQVNPVLINPHRQWYWLRDVVSAAYFANVGSVGSAYYGNASSVGGVRPVFGVIG